MAIETMNGANVDLAAKLQQYKQRAEQMQTEHARAEAQLEQIAKQREEALRELAELGVTEEGLEVEIQRVDAEINQLLEEIRRHLEPEGEANADVA